jgi:hypothetical protein
MQALISILFLTFTLSTQALKLRTLAISPERLKLIQENSHININHKKVEGIINETPEFEMKVREGHPAYKTPFSSLPQMTIDRTESNIAN